LNGRNWRRTLEAERLYRVLMNCDPTDAAPPFNLANLFRATGRKIEAEAALHAATRADPTFAEAWYNLSDLLDEQGRSKAAIDCLRRALQAAPDYTDAMFNLALCYSDIVGTRKRRSTGGTISPRTANLNGQHGRVGP
jgi:tetratricopeptide (TPR) repeat protein